jgi:hypothetical protein
VSFWSDEIEERLKMSNLEFCKQQLEAAALETGDKLQAAVEGLMRRLLREKLRQARDRTALKVWATEELRKLERIPGSGMSKVVPAAKLSETSRRMGMLQTVLEVLEGAAGTEAA